MLSVASKVHRHTKSTTEIQSTVILNILDRPPVLAGARKESMQRQSIVDYYSLWNVRRVCTVQLQKSNQAAVADDGRKFSKSISDRAP